MPPADSPHRIPLRPGLLLLVLVGLLAAVFAWRWDRRAASSTPGAPAPEGAAVDAKVLGEFLAIERREEEVDRTTWAAEVQGRERGGAIDQLWDDLNAAAPADRLALLQRAPFAGVRVPEFSAPRSLPQGIQRWQADSKAPAHPVSNWRDRVQDWINQGWELDQSEWRHLAFTPAAGAAPARSRYDVHLHLSRRQPVTRAQVTASLVIDWPSAPGAGPAAGLGLATVESGDLFLRTGPPIFQLEARIEVAPFPKTSWIDPLIVHDLDGDGLAELLLIARNAVLRRRPAPAEPWGLTHLSNHHPGLLFTAILADFTSDRTEDLLIAVRSGLVLLRGDPAGARTWSVPAEPVWTAPERLEYAQALTCGDIDGDGDLDVFLGQYRPPYVHGQMPRPYFDAQDGPPSYLLRNSGDGRFTDDTTRSGLASYRHRRTYGASFVDLDRDGDLDLAVSSDFAGLAAYANDGTGRFTERTTGWFDESRSFGMSHTLADFDADGRADVLLLGMPQPTADRLQALGLERPGFESWARERVRLTFGNRLLYADADGTYRQTTVGRGLARSGWAWSAAAFDLDYDGYPEVHIANGHETRASVREYEPEFWTHDIYVGDSTPNPAVEAYFSAKFARTRGQGWSYGGHDRNRLYLNLAGREFVEVGHLFGVALAEDSRNVVAEDLDGDGDLDLAVTTFEVWPKTRQTLHIFSNTLTAIGHWIGVRLRASPDGHPPVGATVMIRQANGRQQARPWIIGEGYRSQSAPVLRFGLGDRAEPVDVEVRWPGGVVQRITGLPPDRVHDVFTPQP